MNDSVPPTNTPEPAPETQEAAPQATPEAAAPAPEAPVPAATDSAQDIDAQVQAELDAAGGVDQLIEQSLSEAAPAAEAAAEKGDAENPAPAGGTGEFHHQVVRGRISAIRGEDVFIDITGGLSTEGAKLQGVLPLVQFDRPPRMGSIMDFVVDKVNEQEGLVYLSREGAVSLATWDQLVRGSVVEARVTKSNKGGLELEMVGSIRAFMPASQIDLYHVEDLEQFVGQKMEAVVQEIDRKGKKVLLSRRTHLENQKVKNRDKVLAELEVGQEREGVVSSVVDFGAFVDLGGLDGLVHVTDMSHSHVNKPSDVVKAGDKVKVKVLKIDSDKNRIALGMKQVQPDPWEGVADKYKPGEQVSARVTRTANFGAFIEVEPGVEGLLPMSEMSWKRIHKAEEVVKVGDVVQVAILNVDPKKHRLTLSLKAAKGDPWVGASVKYAKDAMVTGTVTGTTDFGAFVELEQGIEGLVHISELDTKRVGQVTDVVKVGDSKEFRIKDIDEEKRKISLSLKPAGSDHGGGGRHGGEQPIVKGKAKPRIPKENLKSGLGNVGGMGLGGLSLDDFK
ncbi:30S ribosomal protein S1 [Algisphaera agarilytica]|uniref:Small subunit ribosomal protein S1 n=1 Tax=Algisphaera agarilytica TaxID=1385975 RepID=A0A7X0LKY0_9BACT|nr:S1 RNA-binding domain-containing protein [Algisphaera agarilytica]MBB6430920.1 small subunit ribosomal protein S1 [Algisphaera agarilytica]